MCESNIEVTERLLAELLCEVVRFGTLQPGVWAGAGPGEWALCISYREGLPPFWLTLTGCQWSQPT